MKGLTFIKTSTFDEKAFGCILGGFVGDATGSFIGISNQAIDDAKVL